MIIIRDYNTEVAYPDDPTSDEWLIFMVTNCGMEWRRALVDLEYNEEQMASCVIFALVFILDLFLQLVNNVITSV